jgi:glycosyltransferase involved in cell wall biosynthesis
LSKQSRILGRFDHSVIPNIINFPNDNFERDGSRTDLGFNPEDLVFLFVAHSSDSIRKGSDVLRKAMQNIRDKQKVKLITIGQRSEKYYEGLNVIELGFVKDKNVLKKAYIAADAFLLPSMSENFPNTIIESHLCGTPVIASNVGGIPEQINPKNGILVELGDVEAWIRELNAFDRNRFNRTEIAATAGHRYDNHAITENYLKLYNSF